LSWYIDQNGLAALYEQMAEIENMPEADRDTLLQSWLEAAQTPSSVARL
jgi:hypothetical protein